MLTAESIEHMGIAGLEGHGIAGLPVSSGIGHIHDGVITAAANHFHARIHRDQRTGIAHILTAQRQNGPQTPTLILPGDASPAQFFVDCPLGAEAFS